MYGLLLEAICEALKAKYGTEQWNAIRQKAGIPHQSFVTHKTYSESVIPRLTKAAVEVTGISQKELMGYNGEKFVGFVGTYGYDRILRVLGRHMRDFLNGLDNLHEYLRFSYPKLKPPSFFCENETRQGLTLHYRSKRKGFLHYVMGQIKAVGEQFYKTHVNIEVISDEETLDMTHVVMQLHFDNTAYQEPDLAADTDLDNLPISSEVFFDVFPFHIVFNRAMVVRNIGCGLSAVMPDIVGQALDEMFSLSRPLVEFTLENVLMHTNNVFELTSVDTIRRLTNDRFDTDTLQTIDSRGCASSSNGRQTGDDLSVILESPDASSLEGDSPFYRSNSNSNSTGSFLSDPADLQESERPHDKLHNFILRGRANDDDPDDGSKRLRLKGQMMFMQEWDAVIFLGTPVMENLEKMFDTGLYINDLSMHDSSRDLVLAGTQQSAELKLALDQEQQKSKKLEESMKKLDVEMKRTDSLLYQMIPKTVADRLRKGEPAVNTCEVFDQVTILFSDVVGFTRICSQITPMAVVSVLNAMYTKFDKLSEKHRVYKVETIGDAYMVVSGAPTVTKFHAQYIGDMAFDMLDAMKELLDPSTGKHMQIRTGLHSGTVVAGVVGLKMPRYCLFGETVNTAARMEANGEAMKIHISETTKKQLDGFPYIVAERGTIEMKGKASMKTYWMTGKSEKIKTGISTVGGEDPALDTEHHPPPAVVVTNSDSAGQEENKNTRPLSVTTSSYQPITLGDQPKEAVFKLDEEALRESVRRGISAGSQMPKLPPPVDGEGQNGHHRKSDQNETKIQAEMETAAEKKVRSRACQLL